MGKILIVDDDLDLLRSTKAILKKGGHEVDVVESGTECIQKIKDLNPDLVLLDIMMPELDGFETLKVLREDEELNTIPIAMLTAKISDENKIQAFETQANWFITKPFTKDELIEKVNWLLDNPPDVIGEEDE